MKNFFKKYVVGIAVAIIILVVCCAVICYTLTYKSVPVSAQHLWYATDLHTYLLYTHFGMTIVGVLGASTAVLVPLLY